MQVQESPASRVRTSAIPSDETSGWRQAIQLGLIFAAIKLAIEFIGNLLAQHFGYGIFRDEMYYIICGRHLAWGYVDQAPMVALQARVSAALFGFHHLALLRLFSGVAGAVKVLLTGMLAWSLGARRMAQALAMIAVLIAPVYLGIDSFLSMNSFEPVFWMGCLLAIILMVRGASPRWWLLFGVLGGLGLLNKPSMAFFLFALLIGMLLTPQRRLLWSRWAVAAVALIVLISLPYALWQVHHHWPTLEWLNNVNHSHKNVKLGPLAFIGQQIMMLNPISILLLLPGLIWLFIAKSAPGFRWIGLAYVLLLAIMIHEFAKDYYLAPFYPVLFAAGAMAWQGKFSPSRRTAWLLPAWCGCMVILGAITLPMGIPVLPPYVWIRYTKALHLTSGKTETAATGPLPQFYADRFGWQKMVADVAKIYNSLPPAERSRTAIFCDNYGEASAINLYGPRYGLPQAISGHQNYFFWGPQNYTGAEMIVLTGPYLGGSGVRMSRLFESVQIAGHTDDALAMPYENAPIYLCKGMHPSLATFWPRLKLWI